MRERHFPRLCHSCQAPLARQEETCWSCSTPWTVTDTVRPRLTVIPGGPPAAIRDRRALTQARMDMDRWVTEGGSVPSEAAAALGATTRRS